MAYRLTLLEVVTPLWQRLLVAGVGPAVTAVLGGLIVWALTTKIQQDRADAERERQDRRADDIRKQDLATADDAIRHELVTFMTEAAGALYLMSQHFWRSRRTLGP